MAASFDLDGMALVEHGSVNCCKWKQQTSTLVVLWFIHTGHSTNQTDITSGGSVRSSHFTQKTV